MEFICTICKDTIYCPDIDHKFHESHNFECMNCYSVIAKKRYPVNIKGGITIFSPMGKLLGDQINAKLIKEQYLIDNPNETVKFLTEEKFFSNVKRGYDKFFFTNMFNSGKEFMPMGDKIYWLSVTSEVKWYAKQGKYPKYIAEPSKETGHVVFHLRNIEKSPQKNIELYLVLSILNEIAKTIKYSKVIFVGNDRIDEPFDIGTISRLLKYDINIVDGRGLLTLDEVASLTNNCELYVGKDSGIAHLVAASGCMNMLVWGYKSSAWMIKTPNNIVCLMDRDSKRDNIINAFHSFNNKF